MTALGPSLCLSTHVHRNLTYLGPRCTCCLWLFHPAKHYGHFHISIHMYSPCYLQRFKPVVFLLYSSEKFSARFFTGRSDCSHLFRTSPAGHVLAAADGTSRRRVASPLPQVCAHHVLTAPDDLVGRRGACTRQQHLTAPTSSHPAEHF